jgi:type I restriction enzyme S subunit
MLDDLTDPSAPICYGVLKPGDRDTRGVPMVRVTDIRGDALDRSELMLITPALDKEFARSRVAPGDVLVSVQGTVGRVAVVPDGMPAANISRTIARIRPADPQIATWIWAALRSPDVQRAMDDLTGGTTRDSLNIGTLRTVAIPIAPLAEQRRIVAKLDALTARTAKAGAELDRVPALVARYKQALLAAAFRGDLTQNWRIARQLPEPRPAKLAEIIEAPIRNGLSVRGSDDPPGARSLRLSALRGGLVDLADVRYLPITDEEAARFRLRDGDVLVSRGNGTKAFVGIAALVPEVGEPTIFPDTAFRVRLARAQARATWFTLIWNAPQTRQQIERAAKTTAGIWKVSQGDLAEVALLLPNPAEQDEIVQRLDTAFTEIDRLAAEAAAARRLLDRLDQAILAKAFRGELVPQDPNDEPASALLERIRAERAATPRTSKRGRRAKDVPELAL